MTIHLASDGPQTLHADTIGAAWLAVAGRLLMVVKSAHVYDTERAYLTGVLAGSLVRGGQLAAAGRLGQAPGLL